MSATVVQVIVGGLLLGAVYALFSSGLTLIWGMMNVVNFAHGDFVMIAMYVAFVLFTSLHLGPEVFVSVPENLLGEVVTVAGLRLEPSRVVAGVAALAVTLGLHLLLTRTALGSRLLAVAEDRTAAMLVGIRPDPMQALAWGLGAACTGVAGALIAMFFYISPTVGESLALVAFVVVCLGGFGSVPGALIAGLGIGVVEALSAFWIGAAFKDVVVFALFLGALWLRPQGLLGKA